MTNKWFNQTHVMTDVGPEESNKYREVYTNIVDNLSVLKQLRIIPPAAEELSDEARQHPPICLIKISASSPEKINTYISMLNTCIVFSLYREIFTFAINSFKYVYYDTDKLLNAYVGYYVNESIITTSLFEKGSKYISFSKAINRHGLRVVSSIHFNEHILGKLYEKYSRLNAALLFFDLKIVYTIIAGNFDIAEIVIQDKENNFIGSIYINFSYIDELNRWSENTTHKLISLNTPNISSSINLSDFLDKEIVK